MGISSKHFELLELIEKNYSFKDIMSKIKLSERNIRYQIDEINDELKKEFRIKINKYDLEWNGKNKEFNDVFKDFKKLYYSYSSHERIDLIIYKILINKENININKLCDALDITKPTLRNDLKKLKIYLEKHNISMVQDKNSYVLKYEDIDFSYFIASYLHKYQRLSLNIILSKKKNFFYEKINLLLSNYFSESYTTFFLIKKNLNLSISNNSLNLFLAFLLVILKFSPRINNNNINFYINTCEFKKFILPIKNISQNHKLILTDFLIGLSYSNKNSLLFFKNWINIEINLYKAITIFSNFYNIDLTKDKILFEELINHIKPMIYRSSKNIFLENSIYDEIIDLYKDIFYKVKISFEKLEETLNIKIHDEEISYLTLIFQRSLKRNYHEKYIEKIALVCNFGLSTSKFLEEKLNDLFYIDNIQIYSLNDFYNIGIKDFDLILSTVDILKLQDDIPIIKVNPLLTKNDIINLSKFKFKKNRDKICIDSFIDELKNNGITIDNQILKDVVLKKYNNHFIESLSSKYFLPSFLEKDLFNEGSCLTIESAIQLSCEPLLKNRYISKSYRDDLISSIRLNNPNIYIGNHTIFPHSANKNNVFTTAISFLKLNEPIIFNNRKCYFIISFCTDMKTDYVDFLIKLTEYFSNIENENLLKKLTIQEIFSRLIKL